MEFNLEKIMSEENVNVYLTDDYIVVQSISFLKNEVGQLLTISHDLYFAKTRERFEEYLDQFLIDGTLVQGKRIKTTFHVREYID